MSKFAVKYKTYKDIINSIQGGLIPSYNYLQDQLDNPKFDELREHYDRVLTAIGVWLRAIKEDFPSEEDLDFEDNINITEEIAKELSEE